MMATEQSATGWCCDDCLFLTANGETPGDWTEEQTAAWLAEIERRSEGYHVTLGLTYGDCACDCTEEQQEARNYEAHSYCERMEFSWRQCDSCGSGLGGKRHAITFWWTREDS